MAEDGQAAEPGEDRAPPDLAAGCSLASSITADDVRRLRAAHPGLPVVAYVNTTAAVKAEADVCCTSANAVEVVESLGTPEVIFIPDRYLGRHVASHTKVRLVLWEGACEVHERFTAREVLTCAPPSRHPRAPRIPSVRRTCLKPPTTWGPRRTWSATSRRRGLARPCFSPSAR
jgi:quinolinate synthetase A subunit